MQRTDLVIPSGLAATLRIPSLAVTTGAAEPDWVEAPLSRQWFRSSPSLRLPMDPRSAKTVRWRSRLAPLAPLPLLLALTCYALAALEVPPPRYLGWPVTAGIIGLAWHLLTIRAEPRQMPYRTRFGDLRIPEVPLEVARQWVAQNPGVIATDEPAPHPHSRRYYVVQATLLLAASVGLLVLLANDGRENNVLLWAAVLILGGTGISAALKAQSSA